MKLYKDIANKKSRKYLPLKNFFNLLIVGWLREHKILNIFFSVIKLFKKFSYCLKNGTLIKMRIRKSKMDSLKWACADICNARK